MVNEDPWLCSDGTVVRRSDFPELAGQLDRLLRNGTVRAVLPGIYAPAELVELPETRMRAVALRHPDAVLTGAAAARGTHWPEVPIDAVDAAVPGGARPQAGFRFTRRRVPPELIMERQGLRMTVPAMTALDLASSACADAIDVALRTRAATLAGLHDALRLTPARDGNVERAALLLDSRDEPWSAAERRAYQHLRAAGITGWKANFPVVLLDRRYFIDIAFRSAHLAIEIDGRLHQTDEALFHSDRWRQNALMFAGWRVLRFSWRMLDEDPEAFVAAVRAALR